MRKTCWTLLFLLFGTFLYSGVDTHVKGKSGNNISGSIIKLEDPDFNCIQSTSSCASGIELIKTRFITKLWYEDILREKRGAWSITVNYDINYLTETAAYSFTSKQLTINYDPNSNTSYKDIDYTLFEVTGENIIQATVTVTSITKTGISSLPNDIHFDLELESEKIFPISEWQNPATKQNTNYVAKNAIVEWRHLPASNELELFWNFVEGAESYDVEWVFIDCGNDPGFTKSSYDYDFANATRINTSNNHYRLSLAYPRGILLFRARPVSPYVKTWHYGKGAWGSDGTGTLSSTFTYLTKTHKNAPSSFSIPAFKFDGMDTTKNWQYTVTYAEEGKKKEVVQYFDGALYDRQSVTLINSDNKAIVGQTLYDFVGRPAISVMPAPLTSTGIHYYDNRTGTDVSNHQTATVDSDQNQNENISKNLVGSPYSYTDFDAENTSGTLPVTGLMSSIHSMGAAKYYSSNNTENSVNSDYIADADEMPFTRTIFTADGTNRILRQSGVGTKHKLGGKDTRYYYSTPGTSELDRLFGNEVGSVVNYKKNIVLDPNGQASVSYIDGKGRTIATALLGQADNLIDIDTRPNSKPRLTDSLHHSNRVLGDSVLSTSKTIFVQSTSTYTFNYQLDNSSFVDCSSGICKYDLFIYILDESTGLRVPITASGLTLTNGGTTIREHVDGSGPYSISFSVPLQFGTYQVVKKLVINQAYQSQLIADFIAYHTNNTGTCYDFVPPPLQTTCDSCEYNCIDNFSTIDPLTQDLIFYDNNGNFVARFDYDTVSKSHPTFPVSPDSMISLGIWDAFYDGYIETCIDNCKDEEITSCEEQYERLKSDMSPGGQYFDNLPDTSNVSYNINGWLNSTEASSITPSSFSSYTPSYSASSWSDIRTNWDSDWADYTVKEHPEFCLFEKHCCYTPPSQVTVNCPRVTDFYTTMDSSSGYCCENENGSILTHAMSDSGYLNFNGTGKSLKTVAYKSDGNGQTYTSSDIDYAKYHDPITGIIGTGIGQLSPTEFYNQQMAPFMAKGVHLQIKADSTSCYYKPTGDNIFVRTTGFDVRYPNYIDYVSSLFSDSIAAVDSMCIVTCEQSVEQWLKDFHCYEALNATLYHDTMLRHDLIALCASSCDLDGAPNDTTSGSITLLINGATASTFEDVISAYRNSKGLNANACPTPKFPSETDCGCDNIFAFATHNTSYKRYNLPLNFSNIYSSEGVALDSLIDDLTGWGLTGQAYENAYNNCMTNGTTSTDDFPTILACENTDSIIYNPLNEDSLCLAKLNEDNYNKAKAAFDAFLLQKAIAWKMEYQDQCIANAKQTEKFYYEYDLEEYHYTLYFFDQADNLVKTVPPEGVYQEINNVKVFDATDHVNLAAVYRHRKDSSQPFDYPKYAMWTNYKYNSLNQLTEQTTPDGGITKFFYDRLGRLVASQNNEQKNTLAYSYTKYDDLDRIVEVGEFNATIPLTYEIARDKDQTTSWDNWINPTSITVGQKHDIVKTYYDNGISTYSYAPQENLRNRIAAISYDKDGDNTYESASHYDYDINGNIKTLVQENTALAYMGGTHAFKRIDYQYDLISGNLNQFDYQKGKEDEQFSHKYEYDADNRLTVAYTSKDEVIWEKESKNFYYAHGTLARTEIGDKQVQAQDYAYTIQGWLKAINSSTGKKDNDLGTDAKALTHNYNFAKDAYGFSLHYFDGDYTATGSGANPNVIASINNTNFTNAGKDLYNGNISKMIVGLTDHNQADVKVTGSAYRYDQLNRIKKYRSFVNSGNDNARSDNHFANVQSSGYYNSDYKYDGNGNIDSLVRNGGFSNMDMDEFSYIYDLTAGYKTDNKLYQVTDAVSSANYGNDLDGQGANNYEYDSIGRLTKDVKEKIDDIKWNVSSRITKIVKDGGNQIIEFDYDPMGKRISKTDKTSARTLITYYVRDIHGHVMATYQNTKVDATSSLPATEEYVINDVHIYGSSRLGTKTVGETLYVLNVPMSTTTPDKSNRVLGNKRYELSNHLGNVLEVISDRKLISSNSTGTVVDHYIANVISYSDYYPFGSLMPDRYTGNSKYRYGFNGQELDNEIKGQGNSYGYGVRMYDPRVGRWLSGDPLTQEMPGKSPYCFVVNSPIILVDDNGEIPILPLLFKAAAGAAIDFSMQFALNMVIYDFNVEKAYDNVDFTSVGVSALQGLNPFSVPGGKWGQAGVDVIADLTVNYFNGNYDNLSSKELYSALTADILVGAMTSLGTSAVGKQFRKHKHKIARWLRSQGVSNTIIRNATGVDLAAQERRRLARLHAQRAAEKAAAEAEAAAREAAAKLARKKEILAQNIRNGRKAEKVVRERLLRAPAITERGGRLLEQVNIKINGTNKSARIDFVIVDKNGKVLVMVDAKYGNADYTKNQKLLIENGGTINSRKYPEVSGSVRGGQMRTGRVRENNGQTSFSYEGDNL